jgi:hypothetical protein
MAARSTLKARAKGAAPRSPYGCRFGRTFPRSLRDSIRRPARSAAKPPRDARPGRRRRSRRQGSAAGHARRCRRDGCDHRVRHRDARHDRDTCGPTC